MSTETITADLGWLGEVELDVAIKHIPGERGSWEAGRQVEPDVPPSFDVEGINHPALSCKKNRFFLMRAYEHDEYFRERLNAAIFAELEDLEPLPMDSVA